MKSIRNVIHDILKEILENRKRLVVGVAIATILCLGSLLFLSGSSKKTYIVCLFLSIAVGFVILFPKTKIDSKAKNIAKIGMIIAYLIVVPHRLFERTEVLVSDFTPLIQGTYFLNVCIIYIVFFLLLLIFQRISIAFGLEGILAMVLAIINHYTTLFRGTGLSFADIGATKTALMVMGGYKYEISPELWKSFLYFAFFIIVGFRLDLPYKGVKTHICITALSIIGICLSIGCYRYGGKWDIEGIRGEKGNILGGERLYGLYYYLYLTSEATGMEKPLNYSERELAKLAEEAETKYEPTDGYNAETIRPNIILIMNEAWADLNVLGDLDVDNDYMPFYHSLSNSSNAVTGYAYVNIIGGLTCNSEFEALTGNSMALLHAAAIPYNMQVNHGIASLATVLGRQGYQTMAMHPNVAAAWNRGEVYKNMGFENFVTLDDFAVPVEKLGESTTDKSDFEELIYLYENRESSKPLFLFNVTIQNHSPYNSMQVPISNHVLGINGKTNLDTRVCDEYLSLIKVTDDALEELISYFAGVEEPVLVCMFGDHQPILDNEIYDAFFEEEDVSEIEKMSLKYRTPYMIWANYDVKFPAYGDISASHISPILCEVSGNEMPTYYKFILNSRKQASAFHVFSDSLFEDEMYDKYRIFQYNQLIEKDYNREIFEIK